MSDCKPPDKPSKRKRPKRSGHDRHEFYTLDELAERYHVSKRLVAEWRAAGKFEAIKFGRRVRVSRAEVERLDREGVA